MRNNQLSMTTSSKTLVCDNCGIAMNWKQTMYQVGDQEFRPGFEYQRPLKEYKGTFCNRCYKNIMKNRTESDKMKINPDNFTQ